MIDLSPVTRMANAIPPRDPNDDDNDEDEENEEDEDRHKPAAFRARRRHLAVATWQRDACGKVRTRF
jgi:hypothetical protein